MSKQQIGVAILVLSKGKVLIGKRLNAYKAGTYGLPGGRVEFKEAIADCIKRELFEETGLQAESIKYLGVIRESQEKSDFVHFIFLCPKYTGEVSNKEPHKCEEWKWYPSDRLPATMLSGHKAAIDMYLQPATDRLIDLYK